MIKKLKNQKYMMDTNLPIIMLLLLFISCGQQKSNQYSTDHHRSEAETERLAIDKPIEIREDKPSTVDDTSHHIYRNDRKSISGKVIKISDGDTFTLLLDIDFDTKVRLDGIDCPEKKQAFSKRATQALSDMIFGKRITVYYDKKDGFGRVLGDVFVGDVHVNQEMIKRGMAWHYKQFSNDEVLAGLELEARQNKVGLWTDPNPIPPWDYRRKKSI